MFHSKTFSQLAKSSKKMAERLVQKFCYPLLPYPKNQFVIIANERTGSNLLVSLLSSHPDIHQCGEIVGESILRQNDIQEKIRLIGAVRYIRNSFKKRFYKQAVGMKFLYHQLQDRYAERWGITELSDILNELRKNKKIKIIHLKRRNHLKVLISAELAKLTKEYVKRDPNSAIQEIQLTLKSKKCTSFFQTIDENEKYFDKCFQSHEKLEIYYEDLVSDTENVCHKVLDLLQVEKCDLKSTTLKQSQKPLSERIQNYTELKQYFKNTPSGIFFED
jgi:LPS sulfotransferase NodH